MKKSLGEFACLSDEFRTATSGCRLSAQACVLLSSTLTIACMIVGVHRHQQQQQQQRISVGSTSPRSTDQQLQPSLNHETFLSLPATLTSTASLSSSSSAAAACTSDAPP